MARRNMNMNDVGIDDFNSSDIGIPDVPNPWAHLGAGSITSMLDRQFEDRVASKIASKQLTQVSGAPLTQRNRAMWWQRFEAFCKNTLRHKDGTIPKGEDIERHILIVVDHIEPRGEHKEMEAISYSCIYNELKWIINGCQFRFAKFTLNKRDRMRLDNVIATLIKEGKVTKNPACEKQWLGANIIGGMAKAILIDGIESGTLSWDVTICRVLSIILISASSSRSGDIGRSHYYDNLVCMQFHHIVIKLIMKDGKERITAEFEMAYTKGKKDTQADNPKKRINALDSPNLNHMCPVKMLLIYALRIGAVYSNNIYDMLNETRKRRDKTVQWTDGKIPVLPSFQNRGRGVIPDKSARTGNVLANLKLGAELLGIKKDVVTHDTRRGAASDIANLVDENFQGALNDSVVSNLGHTHKAVEMGVTRNYIGSLKTDAWELRTANMEPDPFGIEIAPAPFKRRKYTDKNAITKCCEEIEGLDPSKSKDRQTASRHLRELEKTEFFDGISPLLDKSEDEDPVVVRTRKPLAKCSVSGTNEKIVLKRNTLDTGKKLGAKYSLGKKCKTSGTSKSQIDPVLLGASTEWGSTSSMAELPSAETSEGRTFIEDDEDILADAMLDMDDLWIADSIEALISGQASADINAFQEMYDPLNDETFGKNASEPLQLDPLAFVDYFSKINIINSDHDPTNQVSGGSRDEWTRFQNQCPNHIYGCTTTFNRVSEINRHAISCKRSSFEAEAEIDAKLAAPALYTCGICEEGFAREDAYKFHITKCGDKWKPVSCKEHSCDPTILFKTKRAFVNHRMNMHGSFTPRVCPLKEVCGKETEYTIRGSYTSHLVRTHRLTGEEFAKYLPGRKSADKGKFNKKNKDNVT